MNPSHRHRPPRVRFPNVERRSRGGKFVFRARLQIEGVTLVGAWRASQAEAFAETEELRARRARRVEGGPLSISGALAAVVRDGRRRRLQRNTLRQHLLGHARYWLRFWEPHSPLEEIDAQELGWAVSEALARGRHPNTLRGKDLPILDRAFRLARLPSPVASVREEFRVALRPRRTLARVLRLEDVRRILAGIRFGDFSHKVRSKHVETDLAARERHADLAELIACTGIRCGELARVEVKDFDLRVGILRIPLPKDRSNPRAVPIPPSLRPAVERLLAAAEPSGLLFPGGMAYVTLALHRWSKRLGEPGFHARALRHFYATQLYNADTPLTDVRDALGHKNIATTDRYVHGSSDALARQVQRLGAALAGGDAAGAPGEQRP